LLLHSFKEPLSAIALTKADLLNILILFQELFFTFGASNLILINEPSKKNRDIFSGFTLHSISPLF